MRIDFVGPPPIYNFDVGREGNPISMIVDHWMGTPGLAAGDLLDSALARFRSSASRVSAHYLVSAEGRVLQLVADEDTAFHAGRYPVNQLSIGVEHECSATLPPSEALYAASAALHRRLSEDYGLRLIVGDDVRPHRAVVPTACPGTLDLERIVALAKEEIVTDEEFLEKTVRLITPTLLAMKAAYDPLVAWARQNGQLDADQEAAIARIDDALGPGGVKLIIETQLGVRDEALKPRPTDGDRP